MSRIETRKVLICECGREHILDQSIFSSIMPKESQPVVISIPKTKAPPMLKERKKFKSREYRAIPSLDVEDFIDRAKKKLGRKYKNTTEYDACLRKIAICIKTGQSYFAKAESDAETHRMSVIARRMGFYRHTKHSHRSR